MTTRPQPLHDVGCVVHVHSTFSDGGASVPELAATAARSGAQVLLLTDHDTLEARRQGHEGWRDGVLVLVGHEVSPDRGHLLVFGTEEEIAHRGRSEQEIIAAARARGGTLFAAHPFSDGARMSRRIGRPHPWSELETEAVGIELWSLQTDSGERWRSPLEAIRFLRDPARAITGPPPEHLAAWDALCARRRVPALGGLDAHDPHLRLGRRVLRPLPNERYFGLLRTRVLLESPLGADVAAAAAQVYGALAQGRCYMATEAFGSAEGFAFWAEGEREVLAMGAQGPPGAWTLHARTPAPARLRLVRDGREIVALHGTALDHDIREPGVYRIEAHRMVGGRQRTWIVSNPIYLRHTMADHT